MRARTFLKLTLRECGLLSTALLVVASVRVALWILPSRLCLRWVSRLSRPADTASPSASAEVIWAVEAAGRRIPRASCLTQAIAATLMLRWLGLHAQLCFGVAYTVDGALRAHAWLEQGGRPVLGGPGIQSLVRLPDFPEGVTIHASPTR